MIAEGADDPPPAVGTDILEDSYGITASGSAKCEFGCHDRHSEQKHAGYIDDKERGSAVGLRFGREAPNVAESYGRPHRSRDKAYL